jgi:hypothetical protein
MAAVKDINLQDARPGDCGNICIELPDGRLLRRQGYVRERRRDGTLVLKFVGGRELKVRTRETPA